MALRDEVLKNFFTKTKKPLPTTPFQQEKISQSRTIHRYRVFDDPIAEENESKTLTTNLGQTQDKPKTNLGQKQCVTQETSDELKTNLEKKSDTIKETTNEVKTNLGQTQDKPKTNLGQKQHVAQETSDELKTSLEKKSDTIKETTNEVKINLGQTGDKPRTELGTNLGQEKHIASETSDKPRTELRTEPRTNLGQTQDNFPILCSFSSLVGLQRKITLFIYEACKISRSRVTCPLSTEHLAQSCETTKFSVQKTIQRLEIKKIILRNNFKNGRGGWTQYELSDAIFQDIIHEETQSKLRTNLGQTQDKPKTEPRTEPRTSLSSSSSSSYIINNKTTTTDPDQKKSELSPEWNLDIDSLSSIGFTKNHLMQIADQNKLTPDMVQESIFAFAYDLTHNDTKKFATNPLNYFMGILRKGIPYAPPVGYESPQDAAMRQYLERQEAIKRQRQEMEQRAFELAFEEWVMQLEAEEKDRIIPQHARKFAPAAKSCLKEHFKKEIWAVRVTEIMGGV